MDDFTICTINKTLVSLSSKEEVYSFMGDVRATAKRIVTSIKDKN